MTAALLNGVLIGCMDCMTETDGNVYGALGWIVERLDALGIPYQIVGGLAARVFGSRRAIVDIDMYIPAACGARLAGELQDYISKPLRHYVEDVWDLQYFQVMMKGQKIEFGLSPGARIFDKKSNQWIDQSIDFSRSRKVVFAGMQISVMPREDLIAYKTLLGRDVDKCDINEMLAAQTPVTQTWKRQ